MLKNDKSELMKIRPKVKSTVRQNVRVALNAPAVAHVNIKHLSVTSATMINVPDLPKAS